MILGLTYLQAAGLAGVALILIKVVFGEKVKSLVKNSGVKSPETQENYNYEELAVALKTLHDHVYLVGEEEEIEALDSLAKLILRSAEDED